MDNILEKRVKKLLKNLNYSDWSTELKDEYIIQFLKKYNDKDGNNIYHLLFKRSLADDEIYQIKDIIELLASHDIPALGLNNKNQFPYDLSANQSAYSTMLLKQIIAKEYRIEQDQ